MSSRVISDTDPLLAPSASCSSVSVSGCSLSISRPAARRARVLLVEAGPDYRSAEMREAWRSPNPAVALLDPMASEGLVWTELSTARTDRQEPGLYWRGRGAGGSSAINGQIAIRPPMADFEERGLPGWAPDDVLPYFAKLEDDAQFGDEPYHGRGGRRPCGGCRGRSGAPSTRPSRRHAWTEDVNAPRGSGVSPYPINSRDGRRVSVNDAYLEWARDLGTLTVRGYALVDRVLFDGDRAVGVRLADGGEARADTVVLSAGVIHSPAILMRSGIGPAAQLREHGIGVRHELPVGQGMQDHTLALVALPLAESVLAMAAATPGLPTGSYSVWLNKNHSRGELTLASADPADHPVVRQWMLSDPRDLARMRAGVRALVELALRPETARITAGSTEKENPALFAALDSDAALDDHLLATVLDAQHGTSTCRMGAPDAPETVVDCDCRVLGTDGLRVVDASVFPSVARANTNLATIMAGELMADRIA